MHCTVLLVGSGGAGYPAGRKQSKSVPGSLWMKVPCWGWLRARPTPRLKEPREQKVPLIRVQHPQNHLWSCWREGEGGVGPPAPEILVWQVWDGANTFASLTKSQVLPRLLALLIDTFLQGNLVTMQDYDKKWGVHMPLKGSAAVYSSSSLRWTECPVGPALSGTRDRAHR